MEVVVVPQESISEKEECFPVKIAWNITYIKLYIEPLDYAADHGGFPLYFKNVNILLVITSPGTLGEGKGV